MGLLDKLDYGLESEGSEDEVIEDLEVEESKKRDISYLEDSDDKYEGAGKKKMKFTSEREMKRLSKPATAEELNRLRETENLFHSNLFRLQIEEMLMEVQVKEKRKAAFQTWFEKFRSSVMNLADGADEHDLSDTRWLKSLTIKAPLPKLPPQEKGKYRFRKPISVDVVGSFTLETLIGPNFTVDVIVELPKTFCHKEDFRNCCCHVKKAIYLCELMNYISKLNDLVGDVNFISDEINILKPKIEIIPSGKLGKHVTVELNVIVHKKGLNVRQLNPKRNNVSMKWFNEENDNHMDNSESPTPFYNSTVAYDLVLRDNNEFLFNSIQSYKNIKDGIILLKIWLRQRELSSGLGDFNGYLVAMLVLYLLQIRKLNSFMSSYQVVRTVFNYLVTSDWTKNGITLCKKTDDQNVPTMTEFHEYHKVVFIDTTGYYNLCYGMHPVTFQQIKHEAQIGLRALDNPNINSFQVLFMTSVPFYRHFDHLIVFHNKQALLNVADGNLSSEEKLNHCGTIYPQLINLIYEVLKKGFRARVNHFYVRQPQKLRWKADKKFHRPFTLSFGLNLNPESYYLVVDKASENERKDFFDFWGARSELRRFQDGTITEAVVWDAKAFSEKRLICKQVVTYLMRSKLGIDATDFQYVADQFDSFINKKVEEDNMNVLAVFDRLNKEMRNLKGLPLDVVSVQGSSPLFRYTEISPISSAKLSSIDVRNNTEKDSKKKNRLRERMNTNSSVPMFINPVQVIVQMGATNKWPQDIEAIRRLRTAFYLKLGSSLTNQCNLPTQAFTDRLELQKEGFVFHLKIYCPYEISLLKQVIEDGLLKYRHNEISMEVEKQMVFLPKLSSALHGLHEQYSSFGPACCIVKRWINSQMMDNFHISEVVLDMLVASLYLNPGPHEIPQQPQAAFLRFLHMMATTDWNVEYAVLNINNELNREDLLDIETHFTENRDTLPALFIATPYDRKNSLWTKDCPTPLILLRVAQLCANVTSFFEEHVYKSFLLERELGILFEASLEPYDAIIRLNSECISRINASSENYEVETTCSGIPVNGFDPVSIFVRKLRESYNSVALFFYDTYGGSVIGVLWKPGITEPKDFKVPNMAMHTFNPDSEKLHLVKELIVEDFLIIGKGIVKSVEVKEDGNMKTYTFL